MLFVLFRAIFVMSVQLRGFLKKLIRCRTTFNFVVLAAFALVCAGQVFGQASVTTDQSDYPPGSTVQISGAGFAPGETVQLQVVNLTDPPTPADEAGMMLQLTATGVSSVSTIARITFTSCS